MFEELEKQFEAINNAYKSAYEIGFEAGKKEGRKQEQKDWEFAVHWINENVAEGYLSEERGIELLSNPKMAYEEMDKADYLAEMATDRAKEEEDLL